MHTEVFHDFIYTGGTDALAVGRGIFRNKVSVAVIEDRGQVGIIYAGGGTYLTYPFICLGYKFRAQTVASGIGGGYGAYRAADYFSVGAGALNGLNKCGVSGGKGFGGGAGELVGTCL